MKERSNDVACPPIIVINVRSIEAIIKIYSNNKNEIISQIANASLSVMLNKKLFI